MKFRLHADMITQKVTMLLTLEQRLGRFEPERHGGEAMAVGECVGAEALFVGPITTTINLVCAGTRGLESESAFHPAK